MSGKNRRKKTKKQQSQKGETDKPETTEEIEEKKVKMKKIKMKIKNQMKLHVLKNSLLILQKEQWLIQFLICQ